MGMYSKIQWCEATWNPVVGCTKISDGCRNCYAETMAQRLKAMGQVKYRDVVDKDGWTGKIGIGADDCFREPLQRKKPTRYFVDSMGDLFHERVAFSLILKIFGIALATPWHEYIILTKRAERLPLFFEWWKERQREKRYLFGRLAHALEAAEGLTSPEILKRADQYYQEHYDQSGRGKLDYAAPWPLPNITGMVTVEDQEQMHRIAHLLESPFHHYGVSVEPMLGPVEMKFKHRVKKGFVERNEETQEYERRFVRQLDWVIIGGESGPKWRTIDFRHAQDLIDQCRAAGVPVFLKQWDYLDGKGLQKAPFKDNMNYMEYPGEEVESRESRVES